VKIGAINTGSSSLKFKLFEDGAVLKTKTVQNISMSNSAISDVYSKTDLLNIKNHADALKTLIDTMEDEFKTIDILAHRVVHGGEFFTKPTLIDDEVIERLKSLKNLNPLHNEINLAGIIMAKELMPNLKQVALFDTAFHTTMPKEAFLYAIDPMFYEKYGVRKYGFHGLSHSYLTKKAANLLQKNIDELNLITLHLGNGASVCAIKNGKSIDTSMGFTPLEGLVMGSRSGDIDAGVIFYMQRELGLSIDEVDDILNKKSGLVALAKSNDFQKIDDELAIEIFARRIKKYIGAYRELLGRVDGIVFSGGIGENSAMLRERVMGESVDVVKNIKNETIISKKDSEVKILVIKTDEEMEMVTQIEEDPRFCVI
jgi:acetate kinase